MLFIPLKKKRKNDEGVGSPTRAKKGGKTKEARIYIPLKDIHHPNSLALDQSSWLT
jgi:hypothetical protein